MNGLLNKTRFKKILLFIILVSLVLEPLVTTSGMSTVYASSVSAAPSDSSTVSTTMENSATSDSNFNSDISTKINASTTTDKSTESSVDSGTSTTNSLPDNAADTNSNTTADTSDSLTTSQTTDNSNTTTTTDSSNSSNTNSTNATNSTSGINSSTLNNTTNTELEITKEIFPDEIFRKYIISHFDTNKNEKLSSSEISKIENVDVSNMGIEDLTGIEYFTNINYLYCNGNKLKTLNLSKLTNMTVLDCSYNNLSSIDLSKCASLISLECKNNSFAISLDENNSFDLSTVKDFNLENASNWSSNVTIEASKLTLSKDSTTKFITYDYFINAPLIDDTYIKFTMMAAPNNLEDVEINEMTFTDSAFRTYIAENFDKDKNSILSADELNAATYIYAPSKEITNLTGIEKFPNLVYINFEENKLTSLDLTTLINLRSVYCDKNQITQILFNDSNSLIELYCSNNQLSVLDTTSLTELTHLYCDGNLLTALDTTTLTNLIELNCSKNKLYCLDVSTCNALELLECKDNINDITINTMNVIDLSKLPLLDISKVTNLSTGTLNTDKTISLDNFIDGMTITYNYIVSTPLIQATEITFTLLPKLVEIAPVQNEVVPQTASVPPVTTAPSILNYNVTFNTDGGNSVSAQTVQSGSTVSAPSNPTKAGYLFDGWYNGNSKYDFNNAISSDTTLIAHWNVVSAPKPSIKSLKNSKKSQIKVTLKKSENIAGYEISYSTNKKVNKNVIIAETQKTSYTIKNLVKGKTYYVKVRTYNLDSTGNKIYSNYSKIKKLQIQKGIAEVKATSTSATIKSCKITSENNVSVSVKTKAIIKSNDNYYYLFQLPSYKKSVSKKAVPLGQEIKSTSVKFNTPLNLNTSNSLLYSKFVVAIKVKSGYKVISAAKYITNPQDIATFDYSFPQATSKKGLQINADMLNDVNDLGVKNSAFNIPLDMIIAAPGENNYHSGIDYEYNGETYWFRKGMISAYDSLFRKLERQDIVVTAIVLLGWRDDLTYLISPSAREQGHNYYNFNTSDARARKQLEATFSFLAKRYASDDGNGKVVNWIIGNEINSFDVWNYAGTSSLSKHTQLYADSYRLAYTAITSAYRNARLYISLDQCWNTSSSTSFAAKEFLENFAKTIKNSGNITWNIAYHAYPSPLTNPRFWKNSDGLSQKNANSPVISIYNIKVLTDYVKKHYGSNKKIILSEQGFTSASPYGEKVQAAAMAYAYYLSEFNPMIDAFILSRHVDNVAETNNGLNLGLWSNTPGQVEEAYQRKYAWNVYKYMDTPNSTNVTKFALKEIGVSSWKKIIPKYKAKKFNSMPSANE